jgi:exonuclease VII small subunit
VSEGRVAVTGDDGERDSEVGGGYALVSNESGKLGRIGKTKGRFDWEGWFSERAKAMEKRGLAVAKSLDGRLNRRKAKLEKLLAEQKSLRQRIQRLEKARSEGEEVEGELRSTLAKLVKTTRRIEDMRARLEGAFGLFERWGQVAGGGGIADADAIAAMAGNVAKIAADFADMIEEGTDLSEDGMDDMMKDMGEGKRMGPGDSAADELLR